MEELVIKKSSMQGDIHITDSKSYLHRLLIAIAILGGEEKQIIVLNENICDDLLATIDFLKVIGAKVKQDGKNLYVTPIDKGKIDRSKIYFINVRESGTTLRFILPIIATLDLNADITCEGNLIDRPLMPLIEALNDAGCKITIKDDVVICRGKIQNTILSLNPSLSSQYISGLMFALTLNNKLNIRIKGELVSKPYIEMTKDILLEFGYTFINEMNTLFVKRSNHTVKKVFNSTGDWSSAAPFFVGAALTGSVRVFGLNISSRQPDNEIINILRRVGAEIQVNEEYIKVSQGQLNPVDVDIKDSPDLGPILAVLMAASNGKSIMRSIDRIKFKESDRKDSIISLLIGLGVHFEIRSDRIEINGLQDINSPIRYSGNDHRMAMAYSIIGIFNKSLTKISNPQCIQKSYVDYVDEFTRLTVY